MVTFHLSLDLTPFMCLVFKIFTIAFVLLGTFINWDHNVCLTLITQNGWGGWWELNRTSSSPLPLLFSGVDHERPLMASCSQNFQYQRSTLLSCESQSVHSFQYALFHHLQATIIRGKISRTLKMKAKMIMRRKHNCILSSK